MEQTKSRQPRWTACKPLFIPIVGTALDDLDDACLNAVDDAVAFVDASAPIAGKIAAKSLGFSKPLIPIAVNILQELKNTFERSAVFFRPILEIFPSFI